eukprot:6202970-Pleurochrysis_carterae.AAC.2
MHGFPVLHRIACVLAERSRSAPQALVNLCSRWPPPPCEHFPRAAPQACSSPRACAHSQPPKVCIYIFPSLPARLDGRSGSSG